MCGMQCRSDKFIDVYWPISLTSRGKLLLRFDYKALRCYDPRTSQMKRLANCNTEFKFPRSPYPLIEAIPHINSFVSLKALGESPMKIARTNRHNDLVSLFW